uniref:Uncharacterized protein n=1 Tax=Anguilla anguilla TaxID=7936 RepID=A0A0E9R3D8_ANGAN
MENHANQNEIKSKNESYNSHNLLTAVRLFDTFL